MQASAAVYLSNLGTAAGSLDNLEGGVAQSFTTDDHEYYIGNITLTFELGDLASVHQGTLYSYGADGGPETALLDFFAFNAGGSSGWRPLTFFPSDDKFVLDPLTSYLFVEADPDLAGHSVQTSSMVSGYLAEPEHSWVLPDGALDLWEGIWMSSSADYLAIEIEAFQTIPEPSSLPVLGVGVVLIGWMRRRKPVA